MSPRAAIIALLLFQAARSNARACFWDTDILIDQKNGLPRVEGILAGRWERHSDFYFDVLDPANYAPFYAAHGTAGEPEANPFESIVQLGRQLWKPIALGIAILLVAIVTVVRRLRRRLDAGQNPVPLSAAG